MRIPRAPVTPGDRSRSLDTWGRAATSIEQNGKRENGAVLPVLLDLIGSVSLDTGSIAGSRLQPIPARCLLRHAIPRGDVRHNIRLLAGPNPRWWLEEVLINQEDGGAQKRENPNGFSPSSLAFRGEP